MSGTKRRRRVILRNTEYPFADAATVFNDPLYVDFYDPDHSSDEQRYLVIGMSREGHLVIVSYTERNDVIRLISAREVTSAERKAYEEG